MLLSVVAVEGAGGTTTADRCVPMVTDKGEASWWTDEPTTTLGSDSDADGSLLPLAKRVLCCCCWGCN